MRLDDNNSALHTAAICKRLREVRVQVCGSRGLSRFAVLLHLLPSTYGDYEKGRVPPVDVLARASRVTGAPLLWLIRGEPGDFQVQSLQKIEPGFRMSPDDNNSALHTTSICTRLKEVRVQVCGSRRQTYFAVLLHLPPSTYTFYEKGRVPPVDVLDRASRVTGAPLLWLIRGEPGDFQVESLQKVEPALRGGWWGGNR